MLMVGGVGCPFDGSTGLTTGRLRTGSPECFGSLSLVWANSRELSFDNVFWSVAKTEKENCESMWSTDDNYPNNSEWEPRRSKINWLGVMRYINRQSPEI